MKPQAITIQNALLLDLDPMQVQVGALRIEGGRIAAAGSAVTPSAGDEVLDAGGAVVMPGLVNGHTHLYSALAAGMPAPPRTPKNFHEILQYVWWRLDRALDLPLCEASGLVGALDAIHCGTTTLIDHHASPEAIDGSLDAIESGLNRVGLRGVLCYEITDRNGAAGRDAGLRENERYLSKLGTGPTKHFAALAGAHAAFTMCDESLAATADIARRFRTGVHIHVAEDPCDDRICREQYGAPLLDRLQQAGILELPSIFGHCTHLTPEDLSCVNASQVGTAHNTRSNMNNSVGYAPLPNIKRPVQLGTDGIGSDMFAELQTAWFKARDSVAFQGTDETRPGGQAPPSHHEVIGMLDCIGMLVNSARRASQSLGVTLGKLEVGAAADIVVTDYHPATPLSSDNLAGHLVFAMGSRHVRHVLIDGRWRLRDRILVDIDEAALRADAACAAKRLWERMAHIPA